MREIDIAGKRLVIAGKPGSGKTRLAFHLAALADPERRAIWDPQQEFTGFDGPGRYAPKRPGDLAEFARWIESTTPSGARKSSPYDLVIIDEANLAIPSRKAPPEGVMAHIHLGRHFGAAWVSITRRLANLHVDIVELADYIVIFKLLGSNDARRLNSLAPGMGVDAQRLPPYHYIVYDGDGYTLHKPLPLIERAA